MFVSNVWEFINNLQSWWKMARLLGLIRQYICYSAKQALVKKGKKVYFELNLYFSLIITDARKVVVTQEAIYSQPGLLMYYVLHKKLTKE